ncbi:alpha/beta fold hydrolase [Tengunoibacter tsumagoiensis]|uniref:Epoxide hydrolase n=1 Tax=Tengunoibacter tsumagoiensis TaxID=2014871 RepID=A0A401ZVK7_9CHLR|nr:alpha/beta hydrolase [Tengunoibacter tsumagoiensis]GCE10939.1 epoxide hydrolase [Tengunoibacter tsumagoiensis]
MAQDTENWQHQSVLTNGIRMHYVTLGSGPLIVLLHGFPEFWYSWRKQIPFLAELGYKVVAPDLRGYNETDKPRTGYDIPTLLRDIVGLIHALDYQKAIIIGHDWGGALAWMFAINYPQLTDRLVVMNAPHPGAMQRELKTWKQLSKSWYIFAFQLPFLPEYQLGRNHAKLIGTLIYEAAYQKDAFPPDVLERYREAMSKPGALRGGINYYRELFKTQFSLFMGSRQIGIIAAPTLLIWGEQDIALDIALTKDLDAWVPELSIKYVPDSGHWVQQEKPELVNRYLADFLHK